MKKSFIKKLSTQLKNLHQVHSAFKVRNHLIFRTKYIVLPPELHSVGLLSEPPKMNNYLFYFQVQKSMQAFLGLFLIFFNMFMPHGEL